MARNDKDKQTNNPAENRHDNVSSVQTPDADLSRRKFLRNSGVAVGATVVAGAATAQLSKTPYDEKYPVFPENKVELPPNGKSVIIMGGGLSGLQAGVEMAARGFKVTVLEKTGTPGGKLKTWRDKTFGPADDPAKQDPNFKGYVREHGIHAIWGFYNNLREFMHRYGWGLQDLPEDTNMYLYMDKDGKKAEWALSNLPQPFGSLAQAYYMMDMGDYIDQKDQAAVVRFMRKAASFDFTDAKQREYLDSITFRDWATALGLPLAVTDKVMDSMIEMAFFDNAEKASALSLANIFQLLVGSPNDMKINIYMNPPGETFLQPMVDYIRKKGGAVFYNTELTDVEIENGSVKAVTAAQVGNGQQKMARCSICGALLGPDGAEFTKCPFCGTNGDMIKLLDEEHLKERRYKADYFVSAMDTPASRKFYKHNMHHLGGKDYFQKITKLQAVHVYVVNIWYEGQDFWKKNVTHLDGSAAPNFFATGFTDLGITLNWSLPMTVNGGEFTLIKDYTGRDVSIVETQIANADSVAHLSDEEIVARCHQEMKTVMPDIPEYKSFYVNRWDHYTAYRVGDLKNRPDVQSPLENLLFIGDMAFVNHPAVFMEKTNVTAKVATNVLLDKIGQTEGKIRILPSGTPGVVASALKKMGSVFPAT